MEVGVDLRIMVASDGHPFPVMSFEDPGILEEMGYDEHDALAGFLLLVKLLLKTSPQPLTDWPEPTVQEPSVLELDVWTAHGIGQTTDGCEGIKMRHVCIHGHPTWHEYLLYG